MFRFFTIVAFLFGLVSVATAQIAIAVQFDGGTTQIQLPNGDPVSNGATLEFGHFDSGSYQGETDYATVKSYFTYIDPINITVASAGNFNASYFPHTGGTAGQPLSILVHDSGNNAIGVFSSGNAAWVYPSGFGNALLSPSNGPITADLGDAAQVRLAPIPEPSTYAFILGIIALGGIYLRRRKAA